MATPATKTRTETDLLGTMEVPADAYYGIHTVRAVQNYQISGTTIGAHPNLIRAYATVKKACAMANRDIGVLEPNKAVAIIAACDDVSEGLYNDQFPIDLFQGGAGTSTNMNMNEVLANVALEKLGKPKGSYDIINPNDHVNMSQSTNDSYPTALRYAMLLSVVDLADELRELQTSFENKSAEFAHMLKLGRTQLQDAVPMSVGQEFGAFAVLVAEERKHLRMLADLLLEVNLGGTAIGTRVNAPEGYPTAAVGHLAQLSGFGFTLSQNLIEATSDCGAYVSFHGALKRIAVKFSKICNDLRLLSSGPTAGLHEINLPERAAGSSIMPAKVNPIIPEVVNQIAFKVVGNDLGVTLAAEAGQLQLNAMEPVIAQCCFESVKLLAGGSNTLRTKCVDGITVNEKTTTGYVHKSIGLVTFLVPKLGHERADEIGEEAIHEGKTIRQVVIEHGLLNDTELDALFTVDGVLLG
jgi:aspartate ammonia-lyase